MTPTKHPDLIPGKLYSDVSQVAPPATILKFVSFNEATDRLRFKFQSGDNGYIENEDGCIHFSISSDHTFYELPNK